MADLKTSLRRWRFPSQSHNTNLTPPPPPTTSPLAWFHMIATIAAITEKGQRSQRSYGNLSPAIAAIAAIVARASTHHAQSLPSFTVFTSSSYFASLIVFFLKSLPQNSVFERTTHWFLVRCEILRHKRYEVKPFSPKRATFVSPLSKLILLLKRG